MMGGSRRNLKRHKGKRDLQKCAKNFGKNGQNITQK